MTSIGRSPVATTGDGGVGGPLGGRRGGEVRAPGRPASSTGGLLQRARPGVGSAPGSSSGRHRCHPEASVVRRAPAISSDEVHRDGTLRGSPLQSTMAEDRTVGGHRGVFRGGGGPARTPLDVLPSDLIVRRTGTLTWTLPSRSTRGPSGISPTAVLSSGLSPPGSGPIARRRCRWVWCTVISSRATSCRLWAVAGGHRLGVHPHR